MLLDALGLQDCIYSSHIEAYCLETLEVWDVVVDLTVGIGSIVVEVEQADMHCTLAFADLHSCVAPP